MFDLLKKYVENRIQLIKLELVGIMSNLAVKLISSFFLLLISMFVLLMLSLSLAFWLSSMFDSYAIGFASVGGLYILILIIYVIFFKKNIDTMVKDQVVNAVFAIEDDSVTDSEF